MSFAPHPVGYQPGVAAHLRLADAVASPTPATGQLLHLDCSASPCHLTLGVCHQVSQLLQLRRAGAGIQLHGVHPVLRHCLHQLQVAHLFAWAA